LGYPADDTDFSERSDPSQRDIKIRPHVHLPSFSRSVYIDNSVLLKMPPERLLDVAAASPCGLLLAPHSVRETVMDEFLEVVREGFDENSRIFEQLNHYLLSCPEVLEERPWLAGLMVRDHRNLSLRRALEIWALHVMRYARRDQLSANAALRAVGIQPLPLPIDNFESEFHSWPHAPARDRNRGERDLKVSLMPLAGRLRLAETRLRAADEAAEAASKVHDIEIHALRKQLLELWAAHVELSTMNESLLRSTSWRLTEPLRRLVNWSRGDVARAVASPECSPAHESETAAGLLARGAPRKAQIETK
jgi:hypothetical protein